MKAKPFLITGAVVLLLVNTRALAAWRYHRPRTTPVTSPTNATKVAPVVDPNLKKFKDVPVNAVFCYPTDRTHEWFPLIKVSETQAKTIATPASPVSAIRLVSQEAVVCLSKKKAPTSER